jgi:AraC-like DNA-binding protein
VYHLPLPHLFRLQFGTDLQRRVMRGATLIAGQVQDEDAAAFARWRRYLDSGDNRLLNHAVSELILRLERLGFEPHRLVDPGRETDVETPKGQSGRAIRRMCSFIAENIREAIDSAAIARSADLHPKYAMALFKRSTGLSLGQYLTLLRVSYSQALLVEGRMSVIEVAMAWGFGSLSTFTTASGKGPA